MKNIKILTTILWLCALAESFSLTAQTMDLVLSSPETGNQTHQARNSITFAAGYQYTSNGGELNVEFVNPIVSGEVTYTTAINPDNYAINTNLAVKTSGEFLNVNGALNYSIPIGIPKGTRGLQPALSLDYISGFTDGVLGVGWNISGLSSIYRSNQELNIGGRNNVYGSLSDKYVLDGKRLKMTGGTTYGSDGSIYGTELEEFSKIIAHGSTGEGPEWFEVYTKSGLIYEYGNTTDSKVKADGSCIYTWKINKITDRFNNYITFAYYDGVDEHPVYCIEYTGNSSEVTSPFAQINFRYNERPDKSFYYYGGKRFERKLLLDEIEITNNSSVYKTYHLTYISDNYSQLLKVEEEGLNNEKLNPIVFNWSTFNESYSESTHYSDSRSCHFYHGDYNGDGRMDFVTVPIKTSYTSSDQWKLYLANSSGTMVYQTQGSLLTGFIQFIPADYNGDGKFELFVMLPSETSNDNYKVYSHTGTCLLDCQIPSFGELAMDNPMNGYLRVHDFNNDGKTDILALFNTGYKLYEFNGSTGPYCWDSKGLVEMDSGNELTNYNACQYGDFTGDGKTDIIKTTEAQNAQWSLLCFSDNGFYEKGIDGFYSYDLTSSNNKWTSSDFNADGKMDLIIWGKTDDNNNSKEHIHVAINKGNGFEYDITENTASFIFDLTSGNAGFYINDYNGDGFSDFFYVDDNRSKFISFSTGTPGNMINSIINGLGVKTQISYLPMSNNTVYTKGTTGSYPLIDASSAVQLVSEVKINDGIGGVASTTYKYKGARLHQSAMCFAGFTEIEVTNEETNIINTTKFNFHSSKYFPRLYEVKTVFGSTDIATITKTWSEKILSDNRIYPYISSQTEYDNLKNLYVSIAYGTPDNYGNHPTVTKNYGGGHTHTTTYSYGSEDVNNWLIGRPTTISETWTEGGETNTFVTSRTYVSGTNSPNIDQYNSGQNEYWQLDRDYDDFGNLWKEKKSTTGLSTLTTVFDYDSAHGVNLEKVTDAAGSG